MNFGEGLEESLKNNVNNENNNKMGIKHTFHWGSLCFSYILGYSQKPLKSKFSNIQANGSHNRWIF